MNYYSNLKPQLIDHELHRTVYKMTKTTATGNTVSDKISTMLSQVWTDYIADNKLVLFGIICVIGFLIYRYYTKDDKDTKEHFTKEEYKILKDITSTQTSHLKYDTQPTLNPLYPVKDQQEQVYYPPDPLPVNLPDKGIVYTRNLYKDPESEIPINAPKNYDYGNVYEYPSRSYHNGTYNTYENAQDTNIINPLGFPVNFNTSTGNFVGGMTHDNSNVLHAYQSLIDNRDGNLIDSLNYGPNFVDVNMPEYEMDPPYADQ